MKMDTFIEDKDMNQQQEKALEFWLIKMTMKYIVVIG